jgi:hypothetical protein
MLIKAAARAAAAGGTKYAAAVAAGDLQDAQHTPTMPFLLVAAAPFLMPVGDPSAVGPAAAAAHTAATAAAAAAAHDKCEPSAEAVLLMPTPNIVRAVVFEKHIRLKDARPLQLSNA